MSDGWEAYKQYHGKSYSADEDEKRRNLFVQRKADVASHNQMYATGNVAYELGLNHLADYTEEELNLLRGYRSDLLERKGSHMMPCATPYELPSSVDYRDKGCVTPVKNQGQCGSCWAFSTTGALEGQLFRKTGKLVSLSEQQLVDCSSSFGNHGCNGGLPDLAYAYIKAAPGITSEEQYGYVSGNTGKAEDTCRYKPEMAVGTVTGWVDVPSKDDKALEYALATFGPISIAINALGEGFMHYKSGIYNPDSCPGELTDLDHAVLLVGYGTENGLDYWIVKNSWSERWGEGGYVRIARDERNLCGVTTAASYPLV